MSAFFFCLLAWQYRQTRPMPGNTRFPQWLVLHKYLGQSCQTLRIWQFNIKYIIIIERLFIVKSYTIYITWLSKTLSRLWIDSFEACTFNYNISINYHKLQHSGRSCTYFSMCRSSFLSKIVVVSNHTDCTSQLSMIHTKSGLKFR